jgi:hypothetical protein
LHLQFRPIERKLRLKPSSILSIWPNGAQALGQAGVLCRFVVNQACECQQNLRRFATSRFKTSGMGHMKELLLLSMKYVLDLQLFIEIEAAIPQRPLDSSPGAAA